MVLPPPRLSSDASHHYLILSSENADIETIRSKCHTFNPKCSKDILIYYVLAVYGRPPAPSTQPRIMAIAFNRNIYITQEDVMDIFKKHAAEWHEEMNLLVTDDKYSTRQPMGNSPRPTLFNLLEALASDNVTTQEQRNCIRGIVTDFLNRDLSHGKVYTYIGAVVGHDVLHSIVRRLESEPGRLGVPDSNGLARIERAFALTKSTMPVNPTQTNVQKDVNPSSSPVQRETLLKTIQKNLDARKMPPPQSTKDVFDKVRWLPVWRPLTAQPVFGHSLISFHNKVLFFGGSSAQDETLSFASSCVVNLNYFSSRMFVFCGDIPCSRDGHTTNGLTLANAPGVILFGGLSNDKFLNDIHILELDYKRWTHRRPNGQQPLPRDQHAASVYPAKSETGNWRENSASNISEFLFIFGGRTGDPRGTVYCLNDMWCYQISSNTWIEVNILNERPNPRFGFSMLWSEDFSLTLFGGETNGENDCISYKSRRILDDMWHFKINSVQSVSGEAEIKANKSEVLVSGEWQKESYEGKMCARSHYSSIFITQRYQEPQSEPKTIERLIIMTGGITTVTDKGKTKLAETDQVNVYFFSKKQWCTIRPRYAADYIGEPFGARQRHVSCFFETHNTLLRNDKPPVPCIFVQGGFRRDQVLGDAWVLSLTGDDPYKGLQSGGGIAASNSMLDKVGSKNINDIYATSGGYKPHPLWHVRDTYTPGLLWALCSAQHWAFGAILQLVDNSVNASVNSKNVYINFQTHTNNTQANKAMPLPNDADVMLSIQDDGNGLDYPVMNKLLRLYGQTNSGDKQKKKLGIWLWI